MTWDSLTPFIDANAFDFRYGEEKDGDRLIDSQYATSTLYVSTTMNGNETMFGVNFADGRIKGYPVNMKNGRREKKYCVMYVRGRTDYGENRFKDNGDGTVTDESTGLTWMKADSGALEAGAKKDGAMTWQEALAWSENLDYAGHSDWRLPDAKELQSIVDYSRSPDTTDSAAISDVFDVTPIVNEGGKRDFPWYWTGTTHYGPMDGSKAVYVAFGRALGWMPDPRSGGYFLWDVHGAGAQRSDPKRETRVTIRTDEVPRAT